MYVNIYKSIEILILVLIFIYPSAWWRPPPPCLGRVVESHRNLALRESAECCSGNNANTVLEYENYKQTSKIQCSDTSKLSQNAPENASKMLPRCVQNGPKTVPRQPQERLGTGLGTMLAPKGDPGTIKFRKGSSGFPPPAPSWELFGIIFRWFFYVIFCSCFQL